MGDLGPKQRAHAETLFEGIREGKYGRSGEEITSEGTLQRELLEQHPEFNENIAKLLAAGSNDPELLAKWATNYQISRILFYSLEHISAAVRNAAKKSNVSALLWVTKKALPAYWRWREELVLLKRLYNPFRIEAAVSDIQLKEEVRVVLEQVGRISRSRMEEFNLTIKSGSGSPDELHEVAKKFLAGDITDEIPTVKPSWLSQPLEMTSGFSAGGLTDIEKAISRLVDLLKLSYGVEKGSKGKVILGGVDEIHPAVMALSKCFLAERTAEKIPPLYFANMLHSLEELLGDLKTGQMTNPEQLEALMKGIQKATYYRQGGIKATSITDMKSRRLFYETILYLSIDHDAIKKLANLSGPRFNPRDAGRALQVLMESEAGPTKLVERAGRIDFKKGDAVVLDKDQHVFYAAMNQAAPVALKTVTPTGPIADDVLMGQAEILKPPKKGTSKTADPDRETLLRDRLLENILADKGAGLESHKVREIIPNRDGPATVVLDDGRRFPETEIQLHQCGIGCGGLDYG